MLHSGQDYETRKCDKRDVPAYRRGRDSGSHCVPVSEDKENKGCGRKRQKEMRERGRDEMGRLGCIGVKEMGEGRGHWITRAEQCSKG